jgi:hypothetical protein
MRCSFGKINQYASDEVFWDVDFSYKRGNNNFGDRKTVAIPLYHVKFSTEFRQILTPQFWLHFDVVELPIGCFLIQFSKSAANKLPNPIFCFIFHHVFVGDPE